MSEDAKVKSIVEAALFASGRPLKLDELTHLFQESSLPVDRAAVRIALRELSEELGDRAIEFCELVVGTLERRSEDEVYAVLNVTVGPESASLDQRLVDAIATRPAHERPQFYAHLARLASYRLEGARAAALRQRVAQAWASHCD